MRIYIAGKITNFPEYKEKFKAAEEKLKAKGHIIVNPAKLNDILGDDFTHAEYMKICYKLIELCDCIYMLDNWSDSKGAKLELEFAIDRDKDIWIEGEA